MSLKTLLIAAFTGLLLFNNCSNSTQHNQTYKKKLRQWHKERLKNLKAEDGWLNLAGLYWLEKGKNTIGSDSTNDIVFPEKAPDHLGSIYLKKDSISFNNQQDVIVTNQHGEKIEQTSMNHDQEKETTILQHGPLKWFVIKRNNQFGIRLRDLMSPLLNELDSIPAFPIDPDWKIRATFIPQKNRKITVPNVMGETYEENIPGILQFTIDDSTYKLYPIGDREHLFLIFGDETNAESTYGGGRFLSVPAPDEDNKTHIDFNKAYNPPCAFTPFATCPLPPRKNILPVSITAGEKAPGLDVPHH